MADLIQFSNEKSLGPKGTGFHVIFTAASY